MTTLDDQEKQMLRFFRAKFILWAIGLLDEQTERQLNDLHLPGRENWKQMTSRIIGWDAVSIRELYESLRVSMTPREAAMYILDCASAQCVTVEQ